MASHPAVQPARELDPVTDLGVGRPSFRWGMAVAVLGLAALAGFAAYARQFILGECVTGMGTIGSGGVTWGLYIVFAIFLLGVSFAGISLRALTRLFDIRPLEPVSRIAVVMSVVALVLGEACVMADLGRPLQGLLNLPRYANPASPFFGTFTLAVGGYLFVGLTYLFLDGRRDAARCAERCGRFRWLYRLWSLGYREVREGKERHRTVSFWLAVAVLPIMIAASSTLGFIFGTLGGRPGWFNALQAPGFCDSGSGQLHGPTVQSGESTGSKRSG